MPENKARFCPAIDRPTKNTGPLPKIKKDMDQKNELQINDQPLLPFDPPLEAVPQTPADDIETLRVENEELKRTIRLRDARDKIVDGLVTERARSPELLFEAARDKLQFDDEGRLINADVVIADLKRKFPEQFGMLGPQPAIDAGAGTSPGPAPLSKEVLAAMKPAEIAKLDWEIIRQTLNS